MKNKDLNQTLEDGCPVVYVIIISGGHTKILFEKQSCVDGGTEFCLPVDIFYFNKMSKIERKIDIVPYHFDHAGFFGLGVMGICYQVIVINFFGSVEDARTAFPRLESFKLYTPADIVRSGIEKLPDAITETALKVFTNYCLASADKDLIWLGKQLPEGALSLETKVWDSANESINSKE